MEEETVTISENTFKEIIMNLSHAYIALNMFIALKNAPEFILEACLPTQKETLEGIRANLQQFSSNGMEPLDLSLLLRSSIDELDAQLPLSLKGETYAKDKKEAEEFLKTLEIIYPAKNVL